MHTPASHAGHQPAERDAGPGRVLFFRPLMLFDGPGAAGQVRLVQVVLDRTGVAGCIHAVAVSGRGQGLVRGELGVGRVAGRLRGLERAWRELRRRRSAPLAHEHAHEACRYEGSS